MKSLAWNHGAIRWLVFLLLLAAAIALPAFADGGPTPPTGPHADKVKELRNMLKEKINEDLPTSAMLVPWPDTKGGGSATTVMAFSMADSFPNPYGCYGQTDYPHRSNTPPNNANVHAFTECSVNVPEIHVDTQLFKRSCTAWVFCEWKAWGPVGEETRYDRYIARANSAGPCQNGKYKGSSSHYIVGADDNFYYAFTSNIRDITNC